MDAATLYMIVTMPNGEQSTSTMRYPTLEACEAQVELLRTVEPLDRQAPVTSYRCIINHGEPRSPSRYVISLQGAQSDCLCCSLSAWQITASVRAFVASSLHRVRMDCLFARPQSQKARVLF